MESEVDEVTKIILEEVRAIRADVTAIKVEQAAVKAHARMGGIFLGTLFSGIVGTFFFFIRK